MQSKVGTVATATDVPTRIVRDVGSDGTFKKAAFQF